MCVSLRSQNEMEKTLVDWAAVKTCQNSGGGVGGAFRRFFEPMCFEDDFGPYFFPGGASVALKGAEDQKKPNYLLRFTATTWSLSPIKSWRGGGSFNIKKYTNYYIFSDREIALQTVRANPRKRMNLRGRKLGRELCKSQHRRRNLSFQSEYPVSERTHNPTHSRGHAFEAGDEVLVHGGVLHNEVGVKAAGGAPGAGVPLYSTMVAVKTVQNKKVKGMVSMFETFLYRLCLKKRRQTYEEVSRIKKNRQKNFVNSLKTDSEIPS